MPMSKSIIGLPCGKGKSDDLSQLQDRMPKVWKDAERSATVSLLPVLQDVLGTKE